MLSTKEGNHWYHF